jgi:prefoldin subunit 5
MKIFKKSKDTLNQAINLVSILMFVISAILTVTLYLEDSSNASSFIVFGGMGLTVEIAKVIMIVLTGFFILKKSKAIAPTAILTMILVLISIYANYTYSMNVDTRKEEANKTETTAYTQLSKQISDLEDEIKDLKDSKETKENQVIKIDEDITEQTNQRNSESNEYDSIWAKDEVNSQYDKSIEDLQSNRDNLNSEIETIDTKIDTANKKLDKLNSSLADTKQFEYTAMEGINDKRIRIVLGVIFEVIAVALFFLGILRRNILEKEKNGIQSPEQLFENAMQDMIISSTKAYTSMLKKQTELMTENINSSLNGQNRSHTDDIRIVEDEKEETKLIESKEDLKEEKVLNIANIKAYYDYLQKNSKDNVAVGYKKVAENLGLTQGEAQRIYNKLKEKKYLVSADRKTYLQEKNFNEKDFC